MKTTPQRLAGISLFVFVFFVSAGLSFAANAKLPKSDFHKQKDLEKYDTNKDGVLDDLERAAMNADKKQAQKDEKAEAARLREAEMLKKYDTNHDGKLDAAERAAMKADQEKSAPRPTKKPTEPKPETAATTGN